MMIKQFKRQCGYLLIILLLVPCVARGGGLYLYELGTPEVGLAGAGWAARAQDAATVLTNPAGMSRLDRPQLMVGSQAVYLSADFSPNADTTTGGSNGNASSWLPAGGLYYVHPVSPDIHLGVSVAGYFGLALDYEDDWVGRYYVDEIQLQALAVQPAVSYRLNSRFSVGVGLNILYGILKKKNRVNNPESGLADGQVELEDEDVAFQGNLGFLFEPEKDTRFGLTYMTQTDLEFEDHPDFSNLGPTLTTALGNNGLLNSRVNLSMTMPQSLMFSAYHGITDKLAILGNIGWQEWSGFGFVGVSVNAQDTTSLTVNRQYNDTWHVALGIQYKVSDPWLVTAGVAYDTAMVDEADLTPDLPMGEQYRIGLGAQYKWSKGLTLGFAYELVWTGDLDMDLRRGPLAGKVSGTYEDVAMHFINVNLIWTF